MRVIHVMGLIAAAAMLGMPLVELKAQVAATLPASMPAEVNAEQVKLSNWIDGLNNNTEAELTKKLGTPDSRGTWDFQGSKQLLLHYKAGPKATLDFYFFQGVVIKVSYQLMSS